MAQPPQPRVAAETTGKALAPALPSSSSSSSSNESPAAAAEEEEEPEALSSPVAAAAALMTTSSCRTETAEGAHVFHVGQYRLIKDLGVGKSVRSGAFHVGGYSWAVLFYPSGSEPPKQPGERHVSAYLELLTPNADEVRVMFDLTLVDSGQRRRSFFKDGAGLRHATFSTRPPPRPLPRHHPPRCWGVADFARGGLASYIVAGGVVIRCDITVIKPPRVTHTRPIAMLLPGQSNDGRRHILPEKEMIDCADVEVLVRGESIAAQGALLAARSPVLRKKLHESTGIVVGDDGDEKRRHSPDMRVVVTVDDVEPAVFKAMLHFIYTDELIPPESSTGEATTDQTELLRRLFEAAEAYGVERLPQMCEVALCARLSKATVKAASAFADRHRASCNKLKMACLKFCTAETHPPSETIIGSEQRLKRSLLEAGNANDDSEAAADRRLKRLDSYGRVHRLSIDAEAGIISPFRKRERILD